MPDWPDIVRHLASVGIRTLDHEPAPVSGGDISAAWRLRTSDGDLFVKTGPLSAAEMFSAEAEGLAEIARTGTIRVPEVIASGAADTAAFLALEWLDLVTPDASVEHRLGGQLAELHRVSNEQFGWHRNNTIGLTPQINDRSGSWSDFFCEHRLGFQLTLAAEKGFTGELQDDGARLLERLPQFFDDTVEASLLHGDLWRGNVGCADNHPVLFDPAVYYGDRETDLAMTRLFGGFGSTFYSAYEACWPLKDGFAERQHLYQLYHVLNHLNIFGSAYLPKAKALINALL